MAILGGLFSSKKSKSKQENAASISNSPISDFDTVDAESVAGYEHDSHLPRINGPSSVYSNTTASSSKLKLPFRRKKAKLTHPPPGSSSPYLQPHHEKYPSTRSEGAVDSIRPPPVRSTILDPFGGGQSTLSTRSLPIVNSDSCDTTDTPAAPSKKSGGIFSWTRERKKSKSPLQPSREQSVDPSFDLKGFRRIRAADIPESPLSSQHSFTTPPVRSRPREDSVGSESSQRISVAAFREMQARRSAADSPTPSPSLSTPISDSFKRAKSPDSKLPPLAGIPSMDQQRRPLGKSLQSHSPSTLRSSTSSSNPSLSEPDSNDGPRVFTTKLKSKSDVGHGYFSPSSSTRNSSKQATQNLPGSSRPRAFSSTSAAALNISGKQVSIGTKDNSPKPSSVAKDSSTSSDSDSSSDDDDAPLATLVQPRRPGSALSSATQKAKPLPPKPLIDIATLTKSSPSSSSAAVSAVSSRPVYNVPVLSPTNVSDRLAKIAQGINSRPPLSRTPGIVSEPDAAARAKSGEVVGRIVPARSATSPDAGLGAPLPESSVSASSSAHSVAPRPHRATISLDTAPANLRAKSPDTFSTSPSNAAISSIAVTKRVTSFPSPERTESPPPVVRPQRTSLCLDDTSDPIVPTPIHHRTPPPRFAVTSRPSFQPNQAALHSSDQHSNIGSSFALQKADLPTLEKSAKLDSSSSKRDTRDLTQSMFSSLDFNRLSLDLGKSEPKPTSFPETTAPTIRVVDPTPKTPAFQLSNNLPLESPSGSLPPNVPKHTSVPEPTTTSPKYLPMISSIPNQPSSGKRQTAATSARSSMAISTSLVSSTSALPTPMSKPHTSSTRPRQPSVITTVSDAPMNNRMPRRPFASSFETYSPTSSTGGSSSGRGQPHTPNDGSDIGVKIERATRKRDGNIVSFGPTNSGGVSTTNAKKPGHMSAKKPGHRKSLSHDEVQKDTVNSLADEETKRRERRRSEAKNAIKLGNVMHKPITLTDDDDGEEHVRGLGIDPRLSMFNPLMGMSTVQPQQIPMNMSGSPWPVPPNQFMMPQSPVNIGPHFLAAHQQAMIVAKQAYQYAVAQQAMVAAADQWELGSSVGMMPGHGGGWTPTGGPVMFPSGPRSMYVGSVYGGSEHGGGGWGSTSVYGGSFGPSPVIGNRSSMLVGSGGYPLPPRSEAGPSGHVTRPGARPRTKTAPSDNTGSGAGLAHLAHEDARARGRTPPPSSWKPSTD